MRSDETIDMAKERIALSGERIPKEAEFIIVTIGETRYLATKQEAESMIKPKESVVQPAEQKSASRQDTSMSMARAPDKRDYMRSFTYEYGRRSRLSGDEQSKRALRAFPKKEEIENGSKEEGK